MVRASGSYPEGHRFESHHRYQNQKLWHEEKYPRGRRGSPAKGVVRETVARVQIPLSPPNCPILLAGNEERTLANAALRHTLAARDRANKFSEKGGLISPTIAERQIPLSPPHQILNRTHKSGLGFSFTKKRLMHICQQPLIVEIQRPLIIRSSMPSTRHGAKRHFLYILQFCFAYVIIILK